MADGPPVVESISSCPHVFCARYRRMVEQQELRVQECSGVWGLSQSRQGGGSGGTGVSSIGKSCGRNVCSLSAIVKPILCDGSVDRPSRRQTSMCGGCAFNVGESCEECAV